MARLANKVCIITCSGSRRGVGCASAADSGQVPVEHAGVGLPVPGHPEHAVYRRAPGEPGAGEK